MINNGYASRLDGQRSFTAHRLVPCFWILKPSYLRWTVWSISSMVVWIDADHNQSRAVCCQNGLWWDLRIWLNTPLIHFSFASLFLSLHHPFWSQIPIQPHLIGLNPSIEEFQQTLMSPNESQPFVGGIPTINCHQSIHMGGIWHCSRTYVFMWLIGDYQ